MIGINLYDINMVKSKRKVRRIRRLKKFGGDIQESLPLPWWSAFIDTKTVDDSEQAHEACMKQDFENVFPHELTTSDYKGQLEYYKAQAFERFWKKFGKGVQDKTIFAKNFFCNNFNYIEDYNDMDPDYVDTRDNTYKIISRFAPASLEKPNYISSKSRNNMERMIDKIIADNSRKE